MITIISEYSCFKLEILKKTIKWHDIDNNQTNGQKTQSMIVFLEGYKIQCTVVAHMLLLVTKFFSRGILVYFPKRR